MNEIWHMVGFVAGIVVLLIVTYVPALSLFLPNLLMGISAK